MVILNSPQNPTGGVIPAADDARHRRPAAERDVMVLSDEIYSRIYFDEPPLSIAACRACWRRPSSWTVFRRPTR
jgi:aspartate aminotransferase